MKTGIFAVLITIALSGIAQATPTIAVVDENVSKEVLFNSLLSRIDTKSSDFGCSDAALVGAPPTCTHNVSEEVSAPGTPHAVDVFDTLTSKPIAFCGVCEQTGFLAAMSCAASSKATVVTVSQTGKMTQPALKARLLNSLEHINLVVFAIPNVDQAAYVAGFIPEAQALPNVVYGVSVDATGHFPKWVDPALVPQEGTVFADNGVSPSGAIGNSFATPRIAQKLASLAKQYPTLSGPEVVALLKTLSLPMKDYPNVYVVR